MIGLIIVITIVVFLTFDYFYSEYKKKQFNVELYRNFSISHLPQNKRYYPKHKDKFLKFGSLCNVTEDIGDAKHYPTEEEAITGYEKYLEFSGITSRLYKPKIDVSKMEQTTN